MARLKLKLFTVLSLTAIVQLTAGSIATYQNAKNGFDTMIDTQLEGAVSTTNYYFDQKAKEALLVAQNYSTNKDLNEIFKVKNREKLDEKIAPIYEELKKEKDISVFEYGDEKGIVFTRGHEPGKFGDDKSDKTSIKNALSGKEVKGFEFGKTGLAVRAFVPIKEGEKVIGTFQTGFNFSDKVLQDIRNSISGDVSLYENNILSKTTNYESKKSIGKEFSDADVYNKILAGKKVKIEDKEKEVIHFFYPLMDPSGEKVQGMIQVTKDISVIYATQQTLFFQVIMVVIIAVLISSIVAILIANGITKPILNLQEFVKEISKGNLKAPLRRLNQRNEMADLTESTREMANNILQLIHKINIAAEHVAASADNLIVKSSNVESSTKNITQMMKEVTKGAETQVRSTSEGATMMEQISAGIEEISVTISQLAHFTRQTAAEAQEGETNLQEAIKQMNEISDSVNNSADVVKLLNSRSQEISKIIDLITSVSEQTNLLSLNASIEAARAGEHGKGFAVVAEEVRKLSEQTEKAALQIAQLIGEIRRDTEKAVQTMEKGTEKVSEGLNIIEKTGDKFKTIVLSSESIAAQVETISANSEEITASTEEVNTTLEEITSTTSKTAIHTKEIYEETEGQQTEISEMNNSVSELRKLSKNLQEETKKFDF